MAKANPLAAILASAMALRHSLGLDAEASAVEAAVSAVLDNGLRTGDIAAVGDTVSSTVEMGDAVVAHLRGT